MLIPVIAIDTSTRTARDYRFYDRVIVAVTSPIQSGISWLLEGVSSGFQNYVYLLHTRTENLALVEENRKLLKSIAALRETEQENLRLRKLLDFQEKFEFKSVVARVVARDTSTDFRMIRINRGERSGIQKNMAVVTNEGAVGRVLRTTADTADVVTILDLLSAIDSIDERSRAPGVVEGYTDDTCQLRYVLRTDDFQPGDILVSSGLSGLFPKGIPVGVVTKVEKKAFGISQHVEVVPSVQFSKLEEVLVVTEHKVENASTHAPAAPSTKSQASKEESKEAKKDEQKKEETKKAGTQE